MPLTFSGLRGDRQPRDWYRLSDLREAAAALGVPFSQWDVIKAVRGLPKPKERRYGNACYGEEHLEAVVAAAKIRLDRAEATDVP